VPVLCVLLVLCWLFGQSVSVFLFEDSRLFLFVMVPLGISGNLVVGEWRLVLLSSVATFH
jgi:hypothetical protein